MLAVTVAMHTTERVFAMARNAELNVLPRPAERRLLPRHNTGLKWVEDKLYQWARYSRAHYGSESNILAVLMDGGFDALACRSTAPAAYDLWPAAVDQVERGLIALRRHWPEYYVAVMRRYFRGRGRDEDNAKELKVSVQTFRMRCTSGLMFLSGRLSP